MAVLAPGRRRRGSREEARADRTCRAGRGRDGRCGAVTGEAVLEVLRRAQKRGARLAATCGGAFVLAQAGVLGRQTSHVALVPRARPAAPAPHRPRRPAAPLCRGRTSPDGGGMAAGLDLCVHLVRCDHGASAAAALARVLLIAPHREGGQAQFVDTRVPRHSGRLSDLRAWLVDNLDRPVSLADMAARARCSQRTLLRQFRAETGQSPQQWLSARRVDAARSLLETTRLSVEEIARHTGLGTGANLRQHMRSAIGVGPRAYRRTYQAGAWAPARRHGTRQGPPRGLGVASAGAAERAAQPLTRRKRCHPGARVGERRVAGAPAVAHVDAAECWVSTVRSARPRRRRGVVARVGAVQAVVRCRQPGRARRGRRALPPVRRGARRAVSRLRGRAARPPTAGGSPGGPVPRAGRCPG